MPEVPIIPATADLVARIMDVIRASGLLSVHYTGSADEGLLRALLSHQPKLEVSVIDMPDRWGTGYAFHYDEREFGNNLPRERPDWLKGVPFYQEGSPEHEVGMYDWPWSSRRQFFKIVAFTGRRPPPLVILFGRSKSVETGEEYVCEDSVCRKQRKFEELIINHPAYTWEEKDGLRIGRWKSGTISAHDKRRIELAKRATDIPI